MPNVTPLSSGLINGHDQLIVEIVEADHEPVVAIRWPGRPTITTIAQYSEVAATATRLLANASVRLASMKAHG